MSKPVRNKANETYWLRERTLAEQAQVKASGMLKQVCTHSELFNGKGYCNTCKVVIK